ncbi:hypothetical protein [Cellulomonas endophytica]|uniref:hypothetical protein n=1 Tax=Cellulomonas endophytica TaxID=2494735 RepID=UPI0010106FBB|nr:hypothetical protein [Cellulomonas endophytica]
MSDETARGTLPIPDYDHLPIGSLGHRLRSLEAEELEVLRRYEVAHGNRVPVLQLVDTRLSELAAGEEPSGGDPAAVAPELAAGAAGAAGGSAVSPAIQGPAQNPPSHGDPTNPAQPRS